MGQFFAYQCSVCGNEFSPNELLYTCPHDGGNLDILLDIKRLKQGISPSQIFSSLKMSMWRYASLLPIAEPSGLGTPIGNVGWTPLYHSKRLSDEYGLDQLFIKDEGRNPTASLKDRASAVVVVHASQNNVKTIVTASTGNAGAALAGMAAALGQNAVIFVPANAPAAKIAQLLIYGSKVIPVKGNYDAAFDLSIKASHEFGWYCRNTGYNPFTIEGKKTAAYEIWEQGLLPYHKSGRNPVVFVPVGDGNIISGFYKGFKDLHDLGWVDQIPRLIGVQAEGSAAIFNAFLIQSNHIQAVDASTIADSISVNYPRDGFRALRAVRNTQGSFITVTDEEILHAIPKIGKHGIFIEPAGAAAFAGVEKALKTGLIQPDDTVYVVNTGNGLKDISAAMRVKPVPEPIEPTMDAVRKLIEKIEGI